MEIDSQLDSIRSLLFAAQPTEPETSGTNAIPLGKVRPSDGSAASAGEERVYEEKEGVSAYKGDANAGDDEGYDKFVRELAFERRAKPTDRLKTEEETAADEASKLEKAEASRLRRMRGEESEDEEAGGKGGRKSKGGEKRKRAAQADDLDEEYGSGEEEREVFALGGGLGEGMEGFESDDLGF